MSFWKGWRPTGVTSSATSPTGPADSLKLQHASDQTKADIQEIINKHQAAALLEANQNIRELQEERADHIDTIQAQGRIIQDFKREFAVEVSTAATEKSDSEEIQELKRQLKEKDVLIEKLSKTSNSNGSTPSNTEDVSALKKTILSLTEKVTEQQDEIDRLQSVLKEIEAFHNRDAFNGGAAESEEEEAFNTSRDTSLCDSDVEEDEDAENAVPSAIAAAQLPRALYNQPTQQMTLNGNQLVLLISSMPANNSVKANQKRLETILQGLHLSPEEVQVLDGCDPTSTNLRNDLFAISGKHAKYPQLFLVNFQQNDINFIGDFDTIMDLNDCQNLETVIGLTPARMNGSL